MLIEKGEEIAPTYCECCGRRTKVVNGFVSDEAGALATYRIRWTEGHVVENGAEFDLIVGEWGGAPSSDRSAVSLLYRVTGHGPGFMIVDAADRALATSPLVGRALGRDEVVGTPLAAEVFAILDAVWLQDERIASLHPDQHC